MGGHQAAHFSPVDAASRESERGHPWSAPWQRLDPAGRRADRGQHRRQRGRAAPAGGGARRCALRAGRSTLQRPNIWEAGAQDGASLSPRSTASTPIPMTAWRSGASSTSCGQSPSKTSMSRSKASATPMARSQPRGSAPTNASPSAPSSSTSSPSSTAPRPTSLSASVSSFSSSRLRTHAQASIK